MQPGEKADLRIDFRVRGRAGKNRIVVYLDQADGPTWDISLACTVFPEASFAVPNGLLEFGQTKPGESLQREVLLETYAENRENLPSLVRATPAPGSVSTKVNDAHDTQVANAVWKRTFPVQVTLKSPTDPGPYGGHLKILLASLGREHETTLRLNGCTLSKYVLAPQVIYFNQLKESGGKRTQQIIVRRTDGAPVQIREIRMNSKLLSVKQVPGKVLV